MMIPDELKEFMVRMSYQSLLDDISDEALSMCIQSFKSYDEEVEFFKGIFYSSIDDVRNNPITMNLFTYLILKYSNIPEIDLEYTVVKSLKDYAEEKINNIDCCVI